MADLTGKQVLTLIDKYQLSNQNSTNIADGSYLVEKTNDKFRSMYRTKKGEKCTPITSDEQVIPKGAQVFTFSKCKVFTSDYESNTDLMVPEVFINASVKSVFMVTVDKSYASFKDRPATKEQIENQLTDEVPA